VPAACGTGFEGAADIASQVRLGRGKGKRIAAEIITRRTRGDSYGVIAHELNRQGIAGRLGGRWYAASVRHYFRKLL